MTYKEHLRIVKLMAERDCYRECLDKLRSAVMGRDVTVRGMGDKQLHEATDEAVDAVRTRLMPEGMEWPRYESGEPVMLGSMVADERGGSAAAISFEFSDGRVYVRDFEGFPSQTLLVGECVKRPQVLAADDDGCCDPGTYRCQEAAFTCDSCGHTVFVDKCMVEEIRYLRAKGIRTLNCCCGHDGKAEPFIIVNEGDECRMLNMGYERHVNEHGVTYFTPKRSCPPKDLTHTKPEPIDSWERIEEDAENIWKKPIELHKSAESTITCRAVDLVRRCKALAGAVE